MGSTKNKRTWGNKTHSFLFLFFPSLPFLLFSFLMLSPLFVISDAETRYSSFHQRRLVEPFNKIFVFCPVDGVVLGNLLHELPGSEGFKVRGRLHSFFCYNFSADIFDCLGSETCCYLERDGYNDVWDQTGNNIKFYYVFSRSRWLVKG